MMSLAAQKEKKIVLRSSDGEEFEVEVATARQSKMISNMINDGCVEGSIPLFNVDARTLAKVIEYCRRHAGATRILDEYDNPNEEIKSWDATYIDVHQTILYDILQAADYLEIKDLLDLACEQVANIIRGKHVEEIRNTFNIKNDFTVEEEKEIRKQHPWLFE
ncbi:SKP1-like protein 1A [Elaeis guineensis]|uniref:SKP1-like protein 1A n=1 Tax=Elaeis guineensis var. tenera TaxID=51953 RepID=UPI003C6D874B